jgi:type I restriction enzyme M protein
VQPQTLLTEFSDIRNHLAANAVGVTRDEVIVREVLKLLFCKLFDERTTPPEDYVAFCAPIDELPQQIKDRIESRLLTSLIASNDRRFPYPADWDSGLTLYADSVAYVVGLLQHYELSDAGRDVVGQGFESLIGPGLRGDEGQFFTPKNVVRMAVLMLDPKPGERLLDPACGSGGFLAAASDHVRANSAVRVEDGTAICGIEKDSFLAALAQAYLALLDEARANVMCEDALKPFGRWKDHPAQSFVPGTFDVIVTNPPFGAKIPVKGDQTLKQYRLARVWQKSKAKTFEATGDLADSRPPQILFIERCLQFLKPGGRMAIVLPDGILGNVNDGYVRQFISEEADLVGVVDCPLETFLPSTPTKTSVLILRKKYGQTLEYPIFMAIADRCGHDRRGKPLRRSDGSVDDDFPEITAAFGAWRQKHRVDF